MNLSYNKKRTIEENGVNHKPAVNVTSVPDKLKTIIGNDPFDIKGKNVTTYVGTGTKLTPFVTKTSTKVNGREVNKEVVNVLNSINFYGLNKNTTNKNIATHGFTFNYMQQNGNKSSTIEAAVDAWQNINRMKTLGYGSLFTFDMETIGGTSKDKRWNPSGVTEFAMHEFDFLTQQRKTTNILMANKDTITTLDKFMNDYKTAYKLGGSTAIKNNNELWVTAMRMSLYDDKRGAELGINEKGYAEVLNLLDSSQAEAGNIDSVMRGIENIKRIASRVEKDPVTGLDKGTLEYINSIGKMHKAVANKTGVVSGHNIINFDRPIAEMAAQNIWQTHTSIINNPNSSADAIKQSKAVLQHMNTQFGGMPHLSFEKGQVLDTLPITRTVMEQFGLGEYGVGNATLEEISNVFYKNQIDAYNGVAHLGVFDSYINQEMILGTSDKLGTSFMDFAINKAGQNGTGLNGILSSNKPQALKGNQLYKATGNVMSSNYSGKAHLNFIKYDNNEVYTNAGYHIKNGKVNHSDFSGNIGFTKGLFYSNTGSERLDFDTLPEEVKTQIRQAYPEFNSQHVYKSSFHTVSNNNKGFVGHEVSFLTTTQEEMEGILGSNLAHVANFNKGSWDIPEKSKSHLTLTGVNSKTGKVFTPFNKKSKTSKEIIEDAINFSIDNVENDRALRSVFNSATSVKKVDALLNFNKEINSKEIGSKVSALLEQGVTMPELIFNGEAHLGKKDAAMLSGIFKRHVGYKYKNQHQADFRTVQNMAVAYDKIIARKDFYQNVIDATAEKFGVDSIGKGFGSNKVNMNTFFQDLVHEASYYSAQQAGLTGDKLIRGARDVRSYTIRPTEYFNNRYDFSLGDKFVFGDRTDVINKVFSNGSNSNMVTFSLDKNNSGLSFINDLRKQYLGAKDNVKYKEGDKKAQGKQALFNFFTDLDNNRNHHGNLFDYQPLADLVDTMNENPLDFNETTAVGILEKAIKHAKSKDIGSGVVKQLGLESAIHFNPKRTTELNSLSVDVIKAIGKDINVAVNYDKDVDSVVNNIMAHFTVSNDVFEKNISHMDKVGKVRSRMIKDDVDTKMRNMLTDIVNTSNQHGIALHLSDDGTLAVSQNGKGGILDNLPKFRMDENGVMYLESGGSKTGLALRMKTVGEGKERRVQFTTNLDEEFGRHGYFQGIFENKLNRDKSIELMDFNKYIGYNKKESREWSMYTGSKMDVMSINSRANLEAVTELYGDMLNPKGSLSHLLDDTYLINKNLPANAKNKMYALKEGKMPPDLRFNEIQDKIALAMAAYDESDPRYKEAMYLLEHSGLGLKDVHASKDNVLIGKRMLGYFSNSYDNTQRPPMYGSGNIKLLKTNNIKATGNSRFVMAGSIIESEDTIGLIKREAGNMQLTSDFMHEQIYMSGPMINEIMKTEKPRILKANINNSTIKDMTEKQLGYVVDGLRETVGSGTFEQARIMDARIFNGIINMPLDTQYFSPNKDMFSVISNKKDKEEMYSRLINLMGDIKIEDGKVNYNRRTGTIVSKGDKLAEYDGFGGVTSVLGSKHDRGVMSYSVRTLENQELTDTQISKILTDNMHMFEGVETNEERLNIMDKLLKKTGVKAQFKVENINRSSLPKTLDSGAEKAMTRLLQSTVGELDSQNRTFFEKINKVAQDNGLGDKYNFTNKFVLSDNAVMAALEDIAGKTNKSVESLIKDTGAGFSSAADVLEKIHSEQFVKSDILFGKNGIFKGASSLANDNIPKHNNQGLNITGTLATAIGLVGKSLDPNNELTPESYTKGLELVTNAMNENSKYNFFKHTVNGANSDSIRKIRVDGTQMIIDNVPENEKGYLNNTSFNNLMIYLNDVIENKNEEQGRRTEESDKLVHKNVNIFDGKSFVKQKEWIGTGVFRENEQGTFLAGGRKIVNTAIVADGETASGVSQAYIDAKREIVKLKKLKDVGALSPGEVSRLNQLQEFTSSQKEYAKFNRFDDQAFATLEFRKFNDTLAADLEAELRVEKPNLTPEKVQWLRRQTGASIRQDQDKIIIDAELNNKTANKIWTDKIKRSKFYDDMDEELTPEMLKTEEYQHLAGAYQAIVGQGRSDKISVDRAQEIHELIQVNAGAMFNNDNVRGIDHRERLINDHGYEAMHIKDFIDADGSIHQETMENAIGKRNILLDLGEDLEDNKRFIAIPSMSQEVGDSKILASWQGKVRTLKDQYDRLQSLEGEGKIAGISTGELSGKDPLERERLLNGSLTEKESIEKRKKIVDSMRGTADEITKLTDSYVQKENAYGQATKVVVSDASERLKILSVTSEHANEEALKAMGVKQAVSENSASFMGKAVVVAEDGTERTLSQLEKLGIHNDFSRTGREYFENAGYFEDDVIKSFGLSNEKEMEEYLSKYGTMRTATRHPQIQSGSVYNTRMFLDTDMNGLNAISVSAASMLKYNGDSDGDSESGLNTTIDKITYAKYERSRQLARQNINGANMTEAEYRQALKNEVLNNQDKYGVTKDAYEGFFQMNAEMSRASIMENVNYAESAKNTLIKDVSNNAKTSEVDNMVYQLDKAVSKTFKENKYQALDYQPQETQIVNGISSVKEAVQIALNNKNSFNDNELKMAQDIASGTKTIAEIKGKEKYSLIDKAMESLEGSNMDESVFKRLQSGLIDRVQTQQYYEEAIAKSTKGAIGSVNSSLYALKNASKILYNQTGDTVLKQHEIELMQEATYQIEEQVISGKKVAFETNDGRLTDIQDIFGRAKNRGKKGVGDNDKRDLANWLNTYVDSDVTNKIFDSMGAAQKEHIEKSQLLTGYQKVIANELDHEVDSEELLNMAKNKYIANSLLDTTTKVVNTDAGLALVRDLSTSAREGSKSGKMNKSTIAGPEASLISQTKNIVNEVSVGESDRILNKSSKGARGEDFNMDALMLDVRDFAEQKQAGSLLSGNMSGKLGVAALGIAAATLITGYAGAHNASRPTPPADDTQPPPQSVPEFFNQQPSTVSPTGDQKGYVINIKADTNKGERHMKRAMKEATRSSQNGNVNINMNYRTTKSGGYSNKDIEDLINNYI